MSNIYYAPNPDPVVEQIKKQVGLELYRVRMYHALWDYIRARCRHDQTRIWLSGRREYEDLYHYDLEKAIEKGHDAVRVLAAQEGLEREKAAASFRQYVEEHQDVFSIFFRLLDDQEKAEVRRAGINPDKYLDYNKEP